jgi:signal transduction histidine kinase
MQRRRGAPARLAEELQQAMLRLENLASQVRSLNEALTASVERHALAEAQRAVLEHALGRSNRLDAMGRLAGGLAHDFNNSLTVIAGYVELLLRRLPEGDPAREDAEEIAKAADQAAELTRQLLTFARHRQPEETVFDLNDIVVAMTKMLGRLIGAQVALETDLAPDPLLVRADRTQIEQIVVNLVLNARDALPRGGTTVIGTRRVWIGPDASDAAGLAAGEYAILRVSDDGVGMDDETRERAFEPFFTTKDAERGTGLGLAVVQGIVERCGGAIQVESELARGTVFTIHLPAAGHDEPACVAAGSPGVSFAQPETWR